MLATEHKVIHDDEPDTEQYHQHGDDLCRPEPRITNEEGVCTHEFDKETTDGIPDEIDTDHVPRTYEPGAS